MHESLEKIKEYSSYYDWYAHISIYDLRFLISQAEKVDQLKAKLKENVNSSADFMTDQIRETFGLGDDFK